MFTRPNVETVVLLGDKRVDGHINIDLDVEKLEGKGGTATYAEIKAYIDKKHGLKVSNLYIAQIKDKLGIDKRANYNIGSGKNHVPNCPKEKEDAIMDEVIYSLRTFGEDVSKNVANELKNNANPEQKI